MQVCDANGVHTVLAAMDRHFEHADMVASTCGLLRQLAKSDSVKTLFVNIEGYKTLEKLLDAHKQSATVCMQARTPPVYRSLHRTHHRRRKLDV